MSVARIGVSLEGPLLREFDRLVDTEGFASRSEALRNLIRESLSRRRVAREGKAVGTITFLYRHDVGMVSHRIVHRQHDFLDLIRSSAHVHLGEETCLEVLIVEGEARRITELTDHLKAVKGVLFAEAVTTSASLR
jgi:CopG family nickel-responsive transcriptional regulator